MEKGMDLNDPFAPDLKSEKIVMCIHCDQEYKEKEIKWDEKSELWVCKYWPTCDGAGLGFDIHLKNDSE